jgi:excisionase family DNA binding protein
MAKQTKTPTAEREVMTVPEAGKVLGLTRARAYDYAARGEFPTIRLGGRILVPTVRFYAWLRGDRPQDQSDVKTGAPAAA